MPQRRYICSFCARAFSRSEHRARHERSHTKEKPFFCDKCPSAFVRRDLLQRHTRTVHAKGRQEQPVTSPTSVPEEPPHYKLTTEQPQIHEPIHPLPSLSSSSTSLSSSASTTPPRSPLTSQPPTPKATPSNTNNNNIIITIDGSQIYRFNEKNIISLLTLSKKFDKLRYLDLNSKVSSFFLIWGTMSNLNLPIVKNDQIAGLDENSSLLYALLAFGAADSSQFEDCLKLLNKSWILILRTNTNPLHIIQSLTILSHIYLLNYSTLKKLNTDLKQELIPIEIILDYLDQTITSILENFQHHDPLFNYWYVFLILSQFSMNYNKKPPSVHRLFLSKAMPSSSTTLRDTLDALSRSPSLPTDNEMSSNCLLMGLSNELQSLKYSQSPSFTQTKNSLHNSIIMANKSFIQAYQQFEIEDNKDMLSNLIMISKRNLLLNCPLKFQDLVVDYITIPTSSHHWNMLQITLKEFNHEQNATFHQICDLNTVDEIALSTQNYLSSLAIPFINNNLGLVALPLLFIGFISNSNLKSDFKSLLNLPSNFALPIIETHLTLMKIFSSRHTSTLSNPIIHSIIYLISEMGTTTSSKLQEEITSFLESPAPLSSDFTTYILKNLELNFTAWLQEVYHSPNRTQFLEGLKLAVTQWTKLSLPSRISPVHDSPVDEKTEVVGMSRSGSNGTFAIPVGERVKLPPISFPMREQRIGMPSGFAMYP